KLPRDSTEASLSRVVLSLLSAVFSSSNFTLIILILCILYPVYGVNHTEPRKPTGFSTRVIHGSSLFHNPNLTKADRVRMAIHQSYARYDYLLGKQSSRVSVDDIEAWVRPEANEYVVEFYIGKPAVKYYAMIDTGSKLFWLQCDPCLKCYNMSIPRYNLETSETFIPMLCDDSDCSNVPGNNCSERYDKCQYTQRYVDDTASTGIMGFDTLFFRDHSLNNGLLMYRWELVTLGCGSYNEFRSMAKPYPPGIVGMNRNPLSLIGQTEHKRFSYCFGDRNEGASGYIRFGDATDFKENDYTSLLLLGGDRNEHYYVTLKDISVGDVSLSLGRFFRYDNEFKEGGFLIDSGSVYTLLYSEAYYKLTAELGRQLNKTSYPSYLLLSCYDLSKITVAKAPVVTFHFEGFDFKLPVQNTWEKEDHDFDGYCLAMIPSSSGQTGMLGNFQQQNVDVGYDLFENRLYLNPKPYCYV
ncbi:hypothetical protein AQUCO_03700111v1, partial [Aquilegia coerulea]